VSRPSFSKRSHRRRAAPPPRDGRRDVALHWRGILARERGTPKIIPPADCQVALVYPNTYAAGMSSLGYQMVYRWINDQPYALAERFFCQARPALSVENQRPLDQFDLVAFSIAYELDDLGMVRFLIQNNVTVRAAERDPRAEPIVLAGGVCLLINRLPIYDVADVFVLGDGEGTVAPIIEAWSVSGGDRKQFLEAITTIEGVEVTDGARQRFGLPSGEEGLLAGNSLEAAPQSAIRNPPLEVPQSAVPLAGSTGGPPAFPPESRIQNPKSVLPHFARTLDSTDAFSAIIAPDTELADRCLIEIARGCPYRCRFCFIGDAVAYRPRPFEAVVEMIERGRRLTSRFGLIAPAVGSHPDIERICEHCRGLNLAVSFSSLRLEDVKPSMLELLAAGGQQSVTVAPEAGSERLRRFLGKRLSDEQVSDFAAQAVRRGLSGLRLYFMVGLPTEQPEDIEAIATLVEAARRSALAAKPTAQTHVTFAVNVSIFVPKPGTPLAEQATPPLAQTKSHLKRLNVLFGRMDDVEFRVPSLTQAEAQRVLSWGGREMLSALLETARTDGSWPNFLAFAKK